MESTDPRPFRVTIGAFMCPICRCFMSSGEVDEAAEGMRQHQDACSRRNARSTSQLPFREIRVEPD